MRLATLARRTVAVTAATALLGSGAISLASSAYALGPAPVVSSATPDASNNTTSIPVTISGSNFVPAADKVDFIPQFSGTEVATIGNLGPDLQNSNSNTLKVNVPLSLAAPGSYSIVVHQQDVGTSGPTVVDSQPCVCFTVTSLGPASATKIALGVASSNTSRGANAIDITGSNIAKGARVEFYKVDCSLDTAITFAAGDKSISNTNTGYPSSTSLHGNFTITAGFQPGRHFVRIINTDNKILNPNDCTVGSAEFWTPYFTAGSLTPSSRGINSLNQVVTLVGQGFEQGSKLDIADLDTANGCTDRTMGQSTVSADGTTITATISLVNNTSGCSGVSTAGRSVTVTSPESASYTLSNQFNATPAPSVSSLNFTRLGRGASVKVTINGANFAGTLVNNVCTGCTSFSFGGGGVTATTTKINSASQAEVQMDIAPDAVLGGRSVTATNADFGNSSKGADTFGTFPLTITKAPVALNLTPASAPKGTAKNVVIQGTDFGGSNGSDGMQVTVSGTGVQAGNATITKGQNGANDTASVQFSVDSAAPAGLRDVILKNPVDFGTYVCTGCFGVDSLSVSPAADANNNPSSTVTLNGIGMTSNSVATLFRVGTDPSTGITAAVNPTTGNNATATFNLVDQAPGKYNLSVTTADAPLTCASCFTVTGQAPTLTSIDPVQGGQGATNIPFTVIGTKLARGTQVVISGVNVHDVTWVDNTKLTGLIDIATGAATGAKDVKLVTADGVYTSNTLTGGFTVNVGPKLKTVSPASVGQGATAFDVTMTGTDFVSPADGEPGTLPDFGPGITVGEVVITQGTTPTGSVTPNDDTLKATITVDPEAATGLRDVKVVNSDKGSATLTGKFTVNAGPKVTSVNPSVLSRGATDQAMTITGSGFAQGATPSIAGVTFGDNVVVSEDGTTITGNVTVAADAARGPRAVTVLNGADKGFGQCSGCFTIADRPSAPSITSITPGKKSITVAWSAPDDNGGSAITSYTVSAGDGVAPVTTAGDVFSATLTGLTAAQQYTVSVVAQNAQGVGPAATRTATPYDVPLAPTSVGASSTSSSVTVTWSGADPRGESIDNYTIKRSNGSTFDETEVGNVSSYTFTNVQPGTALTFTVKAKNDAGYGEYSTASATATAKYATTLTSIKPAGIPLTGSAVTYRGTLKQTNGDPIAGATVLLTLTPDIGTSRNVAVTTDSTGAWAYRTGTTYNTTVRASFGGNNTQDAATATAYKLLIAAKVTRTSPATGSRSSASSPVAIRGSVSPNKAGRLVLLYEGTRLIQRVRVSSSSTWAFNVTLPRGNHRLVVKIAATSGNAAGQSAAFTLVRV